MKKLMQELQNKTPYELLNLLLSHNASAIQVALSKLDVSPDKVSLLDINFHASGNYKKSYKIDIVTEDQRKLEVALLYGFETQKKERDFEVVQEEFEVLCSLYNNAQTQTFFPQPIFAYYMTIDNNNTQIAYFDEFINGENIGSYIRGKSEKKLKKLSKLEGFMMGKIYKEFGKFLEDPKDDNIKVIQNNRGEISLKIVDVGHMVNYTPSDLIRVYCKGNEENKYPDDKELDKKGIKNYYGNLSRPEIIEFPEYFIMGLKEGMGKSHFNLFTSIFEAEMMFPFDSEDNEFLHDMLRILQKNKSNGYIDLKHKFTNLEKKHHPWTPFVKFAIDYCIPKH